MRTEKVAIFLSKQLLRYGVLNGILPTENSFNIVCFFPAAELGTEEEPLVLETPDQVLHLCGRMRDGNLSDIESHLAHTIGH